MAENGRLLNYVDGEWRQSSAADYLDVVNPATNDVLGQVPLSPASEVDQAALRAGTGARPWTILFLVSLLVSIPVPQSW